MTVSGIAGGVSDYGTQRVNEAQAAHRLEQEMQSGNLIGAQPDSTTVQQDLQNQAAQSQAMYSQGSLTGNSLPSDVFVLYGALDQAAQSGNPAAAQQAYTALAQELQQYTDTSEEQTVSSVSDVSVSV